MTLMWNMAEYWDGLVVRRQNKIPRILILLGTEAKIIIKRKRTRIKISKQVRDALTLGEQSFSDANGYFGTTLDLDLNPWSPWLLPLIFVFLHSSLCRAEELCQQTAFREKGTLRIRSCGWPRLVCHDWSVSNCAGFASAPVYTVQKLYSRLQRTLYTCVQCRLFRRFSWSFICKVFILLIVLLNFRVTIPAAGKKEQESSESRCFLSEGAGQSIECC